jgi:hypothetical protein
MPPLAQALRSGTKSPDSYVKLSSDLYAEYVCVLI